MSNRTKMRMSPYPLLAFALFTHVALALQVTDPRFLVWPPAKNVIASGGPIPLCASLGVSTAPGSAATTASSPRLAVMVGGSMEGAGCMARMDERPIARGLAATCPMWAVAGLCCVWGAG
jgi:hypothetical protein